MSSAASTTSTSTDASAVKHFRCELCNVRHEYTPQKYEEHLQCAQHRYLTVLQEYDLWPGKGTPAYLPSRTGHKLKKGVDAETLLTSIDPSSLTLALSLSKPYWFIAKNDPRIVCLPCQVVCESAKELLIHQMDGIPLDATALAQSDQKRSETEMDTSVDDGRVLDTHWEKLDALKFATRLTRLYYCDACDIMVGHTLGPFLSHKQWKSHQNLVKMDAFNDDWNRAESDWNSHIRQLNREKRAGVPLDQYRAKQRQRTDSVSTIDSVETSRSAVSSILPAPTTATADIVEVDPVPPPPPLASTDPCALRIKISLKALDNIGNVIGRDRTLADYVRNTFGVLSYMDADTSDASAPGTFNDRLLYVTGSHETMDNILTDIINMARQTVVVKHICARKPPPVAKYDPKWCQARLTFDSVWLNRLAAYTAPWPPDVYICRVHDIRCLVVDLSSQAVGNSSQLRLFGKHLDVAETIGYMRDFIGAFHLQFDHLCHDGTKKASAPPPITAATILQKRAMEKKSDNPQQVEEITLSDSDGEVETAAKKARSKSPTVDQESSSLAVDGSRNQSPIVEETSKSRENIESGSGVGGNSAVAADVEENEDNHENKDEGCDDDFDEGTGRVDDDADDDDIVEGEEDDVNTTTSALKNNQYPNDDLDEEEEDEQLGSASTSRPSSADSCITIVSSALEDISSDAETLPTSTDNPAQAAPDNPTIPQDNPTVPQDNPAESRTDPAESSDKPAEKAANSPVSPSEPPAATIQSKKNPTKKRPFNRKKKSKALNNPPHMEANPPPKKRRSRAGRSGHARQQMKDDIVRQLLMPTSSAQATAPIDSALTQFRKFVQVSHDGLMSTCYFTMVLNQEAHAKLLTVIESILMHVQHVALNFGPQPVDGKYLVFMSGAGRALKAFVDLAIANVGKPTHLRLMSMCELLWYLDTQPRDPPDVEVDQYLRAVSKLKIKYGAEIKQQPLTPQEISAFGLRVCMVLTYPVDRPGFRRFTKTPCSLKGPLQTFRQRTNRDYDMVLGRPFTINRCLTVRSLYVIGAEGRLRSVFTSLAKICGPPLRVPLAEQINERRTPHMAEASAAFQGGRLDYILQEITNVGRPKKGVHADVVIDVRPHKILLDSNGQSLSRNWFNTIAIKSVEVSSGADVRHLHTFTPSADDSNKAVTSNSGESVKPSTSSDQQTGNPKDISEQNVIRVKGPLAKARRACMLLHMNWNDLRRNQLIASAYVEENATITAHGLLPADPTTPEPRWYQKVSTDSTKQTNQSDAEPGSTNEPIVLDDPFEEDVVGIEEIQAIIDREIDPQTKKILAKVLYEKQEQQRQRMAQKTERQSAAIGKPTPTTAHPPTTRIGTPSPPLIDMLNQPAIPQPYYPIQRMSDQERDAELECLPRDREVMPWVWLGCARDPFWLPEYIPLVSPTEWFYDLNSRLEKRMAIIAENRDVLSLPEPPTFVSTCFEQWAKALSDEQVITRLLESEPIATTAEIAELTKEVSRVATSMILRPPGVELMIRLLSNWKVADLYKHKLMAAILAKDFSGNYLIDQVKHAKRVRFLYACVLYWRTSTLTVTQLSPLFRLSRTISHAIGSSGGTSYIGIPDIGSMSDQKKRVWAFYAFLMNHLMSFLVDASECDYNQTGYNNNYDIKTFPDAGLLKITALMVMEDVNKLDSVVRTELGAFIVCHMTGCLNRAFKDPSTDEVLEVPIADIETPMGGVKYRMANTIIQMLIDSADGVLPAVCFANSDWVKQLMTKMNEISEQRLYNSLIGYRCSRLSLWSRQSPAFVHAVLIPLFEGGDLFRKLIFHLATQPAVGPEASCFGEYLQHWENTTWTWMLESPKSFGYRDRNAVEGLRTAARRELEKLSGAVDAPTIASDRAGKTATGQIVRPLHKY